MFDLQIDVETSSEGRKAHATFMVVSLCIHLVVLGIVLVISHSGTNQSVIRTPVRITYFSQTFSLPPVPDELKVALPGVPTTTAPLAMRPVTVPLTPVGTVPSSAGGGGMDTSVVPSELPAPGAGGNIGQTSAPVSVKVRPDTPVDVSTSVPAVASVEPAPTRTNTSIPQVISPREEKVDRAVPTPAPKKQAEEVAAPPPQKEPPRPSVSPGQIVVLNSSMPSPRRTKLPIPNYPPIARSQRITGEVVVAVTVDTNGYVTDAEVVSSPSPLLNSEALKAARQLRYEPYQLNGTPVRFRVTQAFKFGLQ